MGVAFDLAGEASGVTLTDETGEEVVDVSSGLRVDAADRSLELDGADKLRDGQVKEQSEG